MSYLLLSCVLAMMTRWPRSHDGVVAMHVCDLFFLVIHNPFVVLVVANMAFFFGNTKKVVCLFYFDDS